MYYTSAEYLSILCEFLLGFLKYEIFLIIILSIVQHKVLAVENTAKFGELNYTQ